MHEAQMHERNCFLTLTYNNANLPSDGSLSIRDWQLFAKRVRKTHGAFRYYHCGEYGDENGRPHYHAAIFGLDFSKDAVYTAPSKTSHTVYTSPALDVLWDLGFHQVGSLTFESAAYVARYIMKKVNGDLAEDHYEGVDKTTGEIIQLKPEYTTMSRRPGIGQSWFNKFGSEVFPSDEVITNGNRCRPPKYYDLLLEQRNPALHKSVKAKRRISGNKVAHDNTYDRLIVKELCSKSRMRNHSRSL